MSSMDFGRSTMSRVGANFLVDQCGLPPQLTTSEMLCKESESGRVAAELYAGTCQSAPPADEPGSDSWARAADREWDARKALNGTVARLVWYPEGYSPQLDLELRGGSGHPVVIASVDPAGYAAASGIKPGDRLLSIDGKKDFLDYPASQIHASLVPPTTLVVAGFVGSIAAEVRVCNPIPEPEVVMRNVPSSSVLAEERVIKSTNIDSLFLTIGRQNSRPDGDAAPFLELSRGEAQNLKDAAVAALSSGGRQAFDGKKSKDTLCTATALISGVHVEGGVGWHLPRREYDADNIGSAGSGSTKDAQEQDLLPRPLVVQQALGAARSTAVREENAPSVPSHLFGSLAQRGMSRGSSTAAAEPSNRQDCPRGDRCGTTPPPRVVVDDSGDPSVNIAACSSACSEASDHDTLNDEARLAHESSVADSDLQAI